MSKFRKFLTSTLMVMVVLGMSVLTAPEVGAAAQAGDLIKMDGLSSVYYLGEDGKRYVFPNSETYFSWYSDFSGVVTISATELQSYPLGSNVTMRPGTKLVKITTDPKVYAVAPGGMLHWIQSEADAIALYGVNWASTVVDVPDAFFMSYTIGSPLVSGTYPAGTLLKNVDGSSIYYFDGEDYRKFANEAAFVSNGFSFNNVVTTSMTLTPMGSDITAHEMGFMIDRNINPTGPVIDGSGLTVALNAMTPASMNIPKDVPVEILKINLTAANDGLVNVSGIKLTAHGLGTASDIQNVTVYENGTRLSNSRNIDSNKVAQLNFFDNLVVAAGTTKTLTIKASVNGTQNYGLSVATASDVNSTAATVTGSFPIQSNIMSGSDVDLGTLTFANDGSLPNVKLGDTQATIGKFRVTNGNVEDVTLTALSLRKHADFDANNTDVTNFKLMVDGNVVATTANIYGRYVTFNLSSPVLVAKNNVKRFTVVADVVGGAAKKVGFYLDSNADVTSVGSFYGFSAKVSNGYTGSVATIDAGDVTLLGVNAASDKIKKSSDNVELGTFKVTVNSGKTVELSEIVLSITTANDKAASSSAFEQIENLDLLVKNSNNVYDLSWDSGTSTKKYKNNDLYMILNSGTTYEFVVRADVKSTATNGDYTVAIANAAADLVMKETGDDARITDITPNSVSLKKVEVATPSATLSPNALSLAFNAVVGASDVIMLDFNVKANDVSQLKMTELTIKKNAGDLAFTTAGVTELKLWKNNQVVKTVSASQISSGSEVTFTNLSEVIAPNQTVQYQVSVSLVKDSNNNADTLKLEIPTLGVDIEETDKGELVTVSGLAVVSARTLTAVGVGSLYVAMDTNDLNKDRYFLANTVTDSVASVKMRANNENVKITELVITANENINGLVTELALYDGATKVGSTSVISTSSTIYIAGNDLVVPTVSKNYYLKATLAKFGKDATGQLNKNITFKVEDIKAQGVSSGDDLVEAASIDSGKISYDTNLDGTANSADGTAVSKKMGVVASQISAINLLTTYTGTSLASKLVEGQANNAAIIQITAPNSSNTEQTGDAIKTYLNNIKVKMTSNNVSTTTAVTIERIGGVGSTATTTASAITSGVSYYQFEVSGSDYELTPGQSAYFVVKVTPTFSTSTDPASITVDLDKLDGTDATNTANGGNFIWKDAATGADAKNDLRLNVTNIGGTTLITQN